MITIHLPAWMFWLGLGSGIVTAIPKLKESGQELIQVLRKLRRRDGADKG